MVGTVKFYEEEQGFWERQSLRLQMAIKFGFLYVILMAVTFSYFYLSNRTERRLRFIQANEAFSYQSALQVTNLYSYYYFNAFNKLKSEFKAKTMELNPDLLKIQIIDSTGIIQFDSDELNTEKYHGPRRIISSQAVRERTTLYNRSIRDSLLNQLPPIIESYSENNEVNDKNSHREAQKVVVPYDDFFGKRIAYIVFYYTFTNLQKEINAMFQRIILISIVAIFFLLLMGILLINWNIIDPLKQLVDKIRSISSKDYKLSAIEIQKMIRSGNEILSISRWLENNTKQLKQLVDERTYELADKNIHLMQTTEELKRTQEKLVESAHQAGKAELASSVLHNIGNVITSINVRLNILSQDSNIVKSDKLKKIFQLLMDKKGELDHFLSADPKGEKFIQFFQGYISFLDDKTHDLNEHLEYLLTRISLITDILNTQQRYAGMNIVEVVDIHQLIRDSISIFNEKIERVNIRLDENFDSAIPTLKVERIKLHQILVNIIKNAVEAIQMYDKSDKSMKVETFNQQDNIQIVIQDSGCGISSENLEKLFSWGFTTKTGEKAGHGFGLHSCANSVNSMGGHIKASSEGEGKGARFIITLPKEQRQKRSAK